MRTETRFLVAAALLHGLLLASARVVPQPAPLLTALSSGRGRPVEYDLAVDPPAREQPEAPASPPRADGVPAPDRPASRTNPGRTASAPAAGPTGPEAPAAQEGPPAPSSTASPQAPGVVMAPDDEGPPGFNLPPGLGGPPIWARPGMLPDAPRAAPAPTVAPAPRPIDPHAADAVIGDAMAAKDKAKGIDLPAGGTVASAVGEAVRATDTPSVSRATFEVRLSATGQVLGVRVVASSGGNVAVWERAAREVMARLAGRALAMTSAFAKGAVVYVDMSSALQLPDGSKGKLHQSGSGVSFDVTDIGAHMARVVRTSFRVAALR